MAQQPLAYQNPDFLKAGAGRPVRIIAEYLEPLKRFHDQKIQDTVVFFGSARVDSREQAEQQIRRLNSRPAKGGDVHEARVARSQKPVFVEVRESIGVGATDGVAWRARLPNGVVIEAAVPLPEVVHALSRL